MAVSRVVAPAPQPEPASRHRSATRNVSFLQSDLRCRRYVSDLSNVTPRYLGSASEGRSKLLRSKRFTDAVTLRCRNLPHVGQLLVDEPGELADPSSVFPVLHELRGDGVCRDRAQARGASRPASKFVDRSPRLAARVREVSGIDRFLPSLLLLLFKSR